MPYLIGLIVPLISYFFQIYPRFFNKYFGVDVWSRMLEADYIRKNGHKIPMEKISNGFILEGYFNYPPFFPWLLSFIPKKTLLEIQGFIAPVFDVLQNILVFAIVAGLTGSIFIALTAQVVYATIPLTALENSNLRPRSIGYLNFTAAFYPMLFFSLDQNLYYIGIAFFFTLLCFFTHKFATQSLLFICVFFSIFDRNLWYIFVFVGALIAAIVLSKGYYLRILDGHIANILFWVKNYQFRFAHQVRGLAKEKKKTDFVSFVYHILGTFTPFALIATNFWIMGPFLFLIERLFHIGIIPTEIISNELYYKMSVWVIFFYICALLIISIKYLHPIGEGERYLEMTPVPTAILSSIILHSLLQGNNKNLAVVIFLIILFINIIITIVSQWLGIIHDKTRSMNKDMEEIFAFINKLKYKPRILCIPHQITTMVVFNTKADVLVEIQAGALQKISDVFPIITKPIREIAKKYNLNLLVLKKGYAKLEELKLPRKSIVFETDETMIVKLE